MHALLILLIALIHCSTYSGKRRLASISKACGPTKVTQNPLIYIVCLLSTLVCSAKFQASIQTNSLLCKALPFRPFQIKGKQLYKSYGLNPKISLYCMISHGQSGMWTPALQKQTIKTQNAVIVNGYTLNQTKPAMITNYYQSMTKVSMRPTTMNHTYNDQGSKMNTN